MNRTPAFILAIGASAGGVNALKQLIPQLQTNQQMAVCIVLHLAGNNGAGWLQRRLQQLTSYTCKEPVEGEDLQPDHIYIAPPGKHLLLAKDRFLTGYGPEENGWKPSIDVLFRSAAAVYGKYVIGIILTGLLDDGVIGMSAIRRSGGACIVQDPEEADYPDMPRAVLRQVEVDFCVPLAEMGAAIQQALHRPLPEGTVIPQDVIAEAGIAERMVTNPETVEKLGTLDVLTCPECGGPLWHITNDKVSRYRCQVGHSFTDAELAARQTAALESTLWIALRMMEQRKSLLVKLATEGREKGRLHTAADFEQKAEDMDIHIKRLREILLVP